MNASSHSNKADKLVFYSDPHIGLSRVANTTRASSQMWQRVCLAGAINAVLWQKTATPNIITICGGDLFDTFRNSEEVLAQGLAALSLTDYCLEGNHDVLNQEGTLGSLRFLSDLQNKCHCISSPKLAKPYYEQLPELLIGGKWVDVVAVPHALTQEIFTKSIREACLAIGPLKKDSKRKRILLLHCNVLLPEEFLNDTTLNLDPSTIDLALEAFDYILCGHDHEPKDLYRGRVKVIGTTFPTSKTDTLTDKRILTFDGNDFESLTVWRRDEHTKTFSVDDLPESTDAQFVTVTGSVPSGDAMKVSKAVSKLKDNSEHLLAVFMEVKVGQQAQIDKSSGASPQNLVTKIDKALAGHELEPIWNEAKEGVA